MRVFHVIDSAGIYGAEVVLLNLLQEQVAIGLKPVLCSIGDPGEDEKPLEAEARSRGIPVRKVRIPRGFKPKSSLALLREARFSRADIIHLHGYKDTILLGLPPRLLRKIPAIRTLHGWQATSKLSRFWLYEALDRYCLDRLDGIVAVNAILREKVQSFVKRPSVVTIENGIPPLRFDRERILNENSALARFCEDAQIIGGIGRFSKEKGFAILVRAFALLLAERKGVRLILIGEGSEQEEITRFLRDKGLGEHVHLAGYKHDAAKYLPIFDIFVIPSLTEGLPIVLLEAMQAGVPVVATRVGGVPDVLGNGKLGMLLEPGSADLLAHAISDVIDHMDDASARAKKAREKVLDCYSSRRMAEEYLGFYESVI